MDFNMISTLRRLRQSIATLKYSCFRAKCDKNLHENHLIHPSARLLQRSQESAKHIAPSSNIGLNRRKVRPGRSQKRASEAERRSKARTTTNAPAVVVQKAIQTLR